MRTSDPKAEWKSIRLTLDATTNPRSMDFTKVDEKGKPVGDPSPGIYKIEKGELTICVVVGPGAKRPKEFKTGPGTGLDLDLMTLRRVKK
jgi:uncharacterized protein (TIGR03067 family)